MRLWTLPTRLATACCIVACGEEGRLACSDGSADREDRHQESGVFRGIVSNHSPHEAQEVRLATPWMRAHLRRCSLAVFTHAWPCGGMGSLPRLSEWAGRILSECTKIRVLHSTESYHIVGVGLASIPAPNDPTKSLAGRPSCGLLGVCAGCIRTRGARVPR